MSAREELVRNYAGQWVALRRDEVIAHAQDHDALWLAVTRKGATNVRIVRIPDARKPGKKTVLLR